MTAPQPLRPLKVLRVRSYASVAPPCLVEYTYYTLLLYSMFAPGLGILIPLLAGGMLLILAAFCVIRLESRATAVYASLRLSFAFILSYLVVQSTVHGESIDRNAITWFLMLIIVQSLYLRRGFLHRCVLALFAMGLTALPYLVFSGVGTISERADVDRSMLTGALVGANGLGAWFGFCCLYFTIVGIETKRTGIRVASFLAAVGCLYIAGLSVSRGALVGIAVGITIALCRLLRRSVVQLLVLMILSGTIFNLGVFDRIIAHYTTRGMEDTGRMAVWPLAIKRFLSSPLLGVGASQTLTYVKSRDKLISPHNSFIYVALSSGVLPLVLFVAWWVRAAQNAFSYDERLPDSPFRLPFLVYTFVNTLFGDGAYMTPWGTLAFAVAMAASTSYRVRRLVVHRVERRRLAQHFGHHPELDSL
jgi:hypothetical protein